MAQDLQKALNGEGHLQKGKFTESQQKAFQAIKKLLKAQAHKNCFTWMQEVVQEKLLFSIER